VDDIERQRIIGEARKHIADKDKFNFVSPSADPLTKWRQQAAQFEAEARQGQQQLRDEEARIMREAQSCSPEAWESWFVAMLRRHLPAHVEPSFEGVAEGVGELIAQLRHQLDARDKILDQQRKDITELKIECARLAVKISEVQTDKVLAAMPTASTLRGAVN
jgi:hypothetical protein